MGHQVECTVRWNGKVSKGKALLETDELIFRGTFRLAIPYKTIKTVRAAGGILTVRFAGGTASFTLGPQAERWAQRILHPKSRLEKLSVRAGDKISVIGLADAEFLSELRAAGARIVRGRERAGLPHVFLRADDRGALRRVAAAAKMIASTGGLWLITPRGSSTRSGQATVTEADALAAGRRAGLTDIKVIRFSDTHTAHKFVVPRAARTPAR